MPDTYFQLSLQEQIRTLELATLNSGRPANLFEKDIWVVWALSMLYDSPLVSHLVFKGGTALSKAYKGDTTFSEDVDLTCDIRALAPELAGSAREGIDPIRPTRSQEKKWSDEICKELLPAWLREQAHPIIQAGLAKIIKPWKESGSLNANINLYGFWDDMIFLTKSGDLGMVLKVCGVDFESLDQAGQEFAVMRLESALKSFGPGFQIYQYLFKTNRPEMTHAQQNAGPGMVASFEQP